MRRGAVVVVLLSLACSRKPSNGGLEVQVIVKPQVKANCVGLWVSSGGVEKMTALAPRKSELVFGVAEGDGITGEVRLQARAFLGDCSGTPALNAQSPPRFETFEPGRVNLVMLTIDGALDDADSDGFRARDAGGVDCDDGSALVAPGLDELCTDGLDNDCNGAADCRDVRCEAAFCDDGRACTAGDHCATGQCRGDVACPASTDCMHAFGCAADGGCDLQFAAAGSFCDAGQCRESGECVPFGQEWSCTNGVDDDGDKLVDCFDEVDCISARCDDGLACTTGDRCLPDVGCVGTIACTAPPVGACWSTEGACDSNGGCQYAIETGRACDDAVSCTHGDVCLVDAGCVGRPYVCSGAASCSAGACEGDGGCSGGLLSGTACDDLSSCTAGDTCDAGVCVGSPYSCGDRDCEVGFCTGDGGCGFTPKPAMMACGGTGRCDGLGFCVLPLWPFAPANFVPAAIPDSGYAAAVFFDAGCDAVFDSTDGGFTGWCGPQPVPISTAQDGGGPDLVLLPMRGLVMAAGSRLRLVGTRPVVLAIAGDAELRGSVLAVSDATTPGAGANWAGCGTANGAAGGVETASMRGGGGGGGSFATRGSDGAALSATTAGIGGAVNSNAVRPLRGGCAGGNGAAAVATNIGRGGSGGGALQISVSGTLHVFGAVSASGAGGRPGLAGSAGGGGGGSGGGLLLEAGTLGVHNGATLTCNGGGGGEGSGTGIPGLAGANGSPDSGVYAAGGAGGTSGGGDGANGATSSVDAGAVVQPFCVPTVSGGEGCGAGGGGLGRLRLEGHSGCVIETPVISAVTVTVCP